MLDNGIIRPSRSPMASPLVCVLKGKNGYDGVRLAIDYRYVNRITCDDAYPLSDISSVFQCIGRCNLITVADCKAGYWQISMLKKDQRSSRLSFSFVMMILYDMYDNSNN